MARIRIFHASLNPQYYNVLELSKLTFDEAVEFFEKDGNNCCTTGMYTVNDSVPNEDTLHTVVQEDTMLNWIKVDCCY